MGLDNGVCIKIKNHEIFGNLPTWIKFEEWEKAGGYDLELLYWRKCWNIRDAIFDFLHLNHIKVVNDCSEVMVMPLEVCVELCKTLMTCYTKEWWDNHDDSIWSYDDIKENYPANLLYAMRVLGYLSSRDPDSYEIYFYDSY